MSFKRPAPRVFWRRACCAALVLALRAVPGAQAEDRRPQPPLEIKTLEIKTAGGAVVAVRAELARTAAERAKGLMFRKTLAPGDGMLFIFEKDERLSFWMKNTSLPLSIAFIDRNGRITDIAEMKPFSERPVRSSRSARYALEAPSGWFKRQGIAEGDSLLLDALPRAPLSGTAPAAGLRLNAG